MRPAIPCAAAGDAPGAVPRGGRAGLLAGRPGGPAAAEFLRRKYRLKSSTVASAEDFIERVASFSTTTGRPYRIRLGDGREIESAHFLRTELERLRLQKP